MNLCGTEQNENDAAIISSLLFLMDSNVDHNFANSISHSQAGAPDDEEYLGHRLKDAPCGNVTIQDLWAKLELKPTVTNDRYVNPSNYQIAAGISSLSDGKEDPSLIQMESHSIVPMVNSAGETELRIGQNVTYDCSTRIGLKRSSQSITGEALFSIFLTIELKECFMLRAIN
jgi:hypothetical protein